MAIIALGGRVANGRVMGLNMSRSLGDKFAGEMVSPEPTINRKQLQKGKYRLVLECDGVWRVIYDQQIPEIIRDKSPQEASKTLVDRSYEEGDNLTAIVVDLEIL